MNRRNTMMFLILAFACRDTALAQHDPEFPKGFSMYANLHTGMVTDFHRTPDLFAGGLQLVPQVTVIPALLRVGTIAGAFYQGKKIQGLFGPAVAVKLKTIDADGFGSAGNIHLTANHLWGTGGQRWAGGGLHADILNRVTLGVTAHREYHVNTWWFQQVLGIRISRKRIPVPPFNQ